MAKRRPFVANLPTESSPASTPRRIPADLDNIRRPLKGQRWYQDSMVIPLRLRVSRRGLTWVFYGRTPSGPRRTSLGNYPRIDLDQARLAAQRRAGIAATVPMTFAQLRTAFFESTEFAELAERTRKSYRWVLEGRDYNGFANRKLRSITRQDVFALKDDIHNSGRKYQNIMRPLQKLMSWALDRGYIEVSPAARLKLSANEEDPQPYTDVQVGLVVHAAKTAVYPWRELYLLVAYTGQRPVTWAAAQWNEINLKTGTFTIARSRGRRSKLGRGWAIPLAKPVVDILNAIMKRQGRERNEMLFGRKIAVESKVRNAVAKAAGMAGAANRGNMHRFRSTMIATLNEWGISTETQQRLAGHSSPMDGSRSAYIPVAAPTQDMRKTAARYAEWIDFCALL